MTNRVNLGKSFFIEALGCTSNQVDSNRVRNFFIANGWSEINDINLASIIILMTCAVTKVTEEYNINRLLELSHLKRKEAQIIIGGCLPAINRQRLSGIFNGLVFTPKTLDRLNKYVPSNVKIEDIPPTMVESKQNSLKTIRISTGCMGRCSYCAVHFANGKTKSRNIEEILIDLKSAEEEGFENIKLVSEDIGSYGVDMNLSIVDLIEAISSHKGNYRVYFDTFNPNWFYLFRKKIIELLKNDKFIKNFCIPAQSGSTRLLKLMKREYTIEELETIYDLLYDNFSNVEISTDFIVGFPTETNEDFEETISLLNKFKFKHIQIFTFEERPNTNASTLKPKVSESVKEQRRQKLFIGYMQQFIAENKITDKDSLKSKLDSFNCLPVNFNLILP